MVFVHIVLRRQPYYWGLYFSLKGETLGTSRVVKNITYQLSYRIEKREREKNDIHCKTLHGAKGYLY